MNNINGLSFEQALERLEQIAAQLEDGKATLEQSLKLYEEGAALSAMCTARLRDARQKITELDALSGKSDVEE